jgi:hypothetical protein
MALIKMRAATPAWARPGWPAVAAMLIGTLLAMLSAGTGTSGASAGSPCP